MKKKRIILMLGAVLLAGCTAKPVTENKDGSTTLHIKIMDEVNDKQLLDDEVTVEEPVESLADFLEASDLDAVLEDGSYGKTIMGLMGVETKDFDRGPWWVYESEDNDSCIETGVCDACSSLPIESGDHFTFTYKDSFD